MAATGVPFYIPAVAANGTVASSFKVNGWVPTSAGAPTATRRTFYTDAELTTPAANPATLGASGRVFYVNPALSYAFTITDAAGAVTYDTIYFPAGGTVSGTLFFPVDGYGADNTGVADSTNAIQEASAALEAAGGGTLWFTPGATYKVYPDATDTDSLGDFDNCKGVSIAFNGCTFTIARAFINSQFLFPWVFEGCDGIWWNEHTVTCAQVDTPDLSYQRGINWITVVDRNTQVRGGFVKQTGGKAVVDFVRNSSTATNQISFVDLAGGEASGVGYPIQFRNTGRMCKGGKWKTTNATRPTISYGFQSLELEIERVSTGAAGETQVVFNANGTGSELTLNDPVTRGLKLKYVSTSGLYNGAHIVIEARGTGAVNLSDLDIELDIDMASAGLSQQLIVFYKTSSSGVFDSTTRGHTLENFRLHGMVKNVPAVRVADLFKTSLGDWAGETIRNFSVRDLGVTGSTSATYEIDFDGFVDGPFFENFVFPGDPVITGTVPDTFTEVAVRDKSGLRTLSGGTSLRTPGGRLTLTTALPVTVSDVTAATTVYYAIDKDNRAPFWMGFRFAEAKFTELSLALSSNSGHTGYHQSGKNFDVFLINDAGTLRLATGPAWTSDTARGTGAGTTELARSDGFMTNAVTMTARFGSASGNTVSVAAGRALYVGTFRCTADGQTEDSFAKRFAWNAFNRRPRAMRVMEGADSWSGSGAASWRQANNSTANQLDFVRGLDEDRVNAGTAVAAISSTTTERQIRQGIGLDATNAIATGCFPGLSLVDTGTEFITSSYQGYPGLGRHFLAWLEYDNATDTRTYYGDAGAPTVIQSGIAGEVFA